MGRGNDRQINEILPGVWHWTTPNPGIGDIPVSSYWLDDGGVAIDPLVRRAPGEAGGVEWFATRPQPPAAAVLTNRHHYRDSGRLQTEFGIVVHVPAAGMHAFDDGRPVTAYKPGEKLPGGLTAIEIGGLSADDGALFLPDLEGGVVWVADTLVRAPEDPSADLGWVPDTLMDDPARTKQALLEAFQRVLDEFDFRHLCLAHGLPLIGDGREQLQRFVDAGGHAAADAF